MKSVSCDASMPPINSRFLSLSVITLDSLASLLFPLRLPLMVFSTLLPYYSSIGFYAVVPAPPLLSRRQLKN